MTKIDFSNKSIYVDWVEEVTRALYDPSVRFIFLKGGSGAGKSYLIAQLLVQNILDGARVGFFRKVGSTLRASCLQLTKDIVSGRGLSNYVEIKESKEIRTSRGLGMMFGLDDPEKIKSIANFDWFRIEEATELTYDDFTQLDLRLRGGHNHKIICTFNPVSAKSRLKTEIEDKPDLRTNAVWISKTARDNKFVDEHYLQALDSLKEKNEAKRKIYAQNLWGEGMKGMIYPQYSIFEKDITPDVMGLDFGFNDPNALTYLKVVDDGPKKKLYIQEKIYTTGQTSQDLIQEMEKINVPKNVLIIADSARPEMIADIRKAGYTIRGVDKYKNSKQDQIDHVKSYEIYINGPNILKEVSTYCWKLDKKTNEPLDVPEDGDDHLCDSFAYGATHFKKDGIVALFV